MFGVVNTAWVVLASIYHIAQIGAIYGATSPPLVQMFAVYVLILRDVIEPTEEQIFRKYSAWDPLPKLLQRLSNMKYLSLAHLPQYTMFDILKMMFNLLLSAALLLQTSAFQRERYWALVFLRLSLILLLLSKQQCRQSLLKLVAFHHTSNTAGKGSSGPWYVVQTLSCCFCSPMALSAVNNSSSAEASVTQPTDSAINTPTNTTIDGMPPTQSIAAETVDAYLSGAVSTGTTGRTSHNASKSCAVLCGSPTLLAVLQVACFEGTLLAFLLCVPLLEALALPQSALLFAPVQSLMLACGAFIQCCTLAFMASYLVYRRTIALELRGAERAYNVTCATQERAGDRKPAASSAVSLLAGAVLCVLDCDARLSSMPCSSGTSEVDAFAADLSLTDSTSSATIAGQQALSSGKVSCSNGRSSSSFSSSVGATASLRVNTSSSTYSSDVISTAKTANAATVQFQPHPFILSLCLLVVLAVALVQATLVLLGVTNRKSSAGTALVALAGLVTSVVLRARVPALCSQRRMSNNTVGHAHSGAIPS